MIGTIIAQTAMLWIGFMLIGALVVAVLYSYFALSSKLYAESLHIVMTMREAFTIYFAYVVGFFHGCTEAAQTSGLSKGLSIFIVIISVMIKWPKIYCKFVKSGFNTQVEIDEYLKAVDLAKNSIPLMENHTKEE